MKKRQLLTGGWQTEASPELQPADTVFDLFNMRITNLQNGSYRAESIKGNKVCFQINPDYTAIRLHAAIDYIIVFSTNALGNGEIGIAYVNEATDIGVYMPLYNHRNLDFNQLDPIYSTFIKENSSFQRTQWWDDRNTPRTINIADPLYNTYFNQAAITGAGIGEKYMVLTETVTNGTGAYGPNEALGTVFTVDGTEAFLSVNTLVIAYVAPEVLSLVPMVGVGNIRFNKWIPGGNLYNGNWCYFYQVGDGQAFGPWSYISRPVHITSFIPGAQPEYQNYQGLGIPSNFNTNKGIQIIISNVDTNFSVIRVGAMHFNSMDTHIPPILVSEEVITGATMIIDHVDNFGLAYIPIEELIANKISILKNKTGEINNNYLFLANITLRPQPVYDPSVGTTFRVIPYLMPSDTTDYFLGRHPDYTDTRAVTGLNGHDPGSTVILPDQWYLVEGTPTITTVTYNGIIYGPGNVNGDVFLGVAAVDVYTLPVNVPVVTPIFRIQKYTGAYENIKITDDYLDHKGMTGSTFMKSFWRGQKYRLAMLLHDLNGNPTYAKWMRDETFPQQYETLDQSGNAINANLTEEYTNSGGAGYTQFSLRSLGLEINNLNLKEIADNLGIAVADLPLYFRGFSIVRAPLDSTILGQGILFPTVRDTATASKNYPMTAVQPVGQFAYTFVAGTPTRYENYYAFYSPDFLLNFNDLPNKVPGDKLKVVAYYSDLNMTEPGNGKGTRETDGDHWYHKYMYRDTAPDAHYTAIGTENEVVINSTKEIQSGQEGVQLTPGLTFWNVGAVNSAMTQIAATCVCVGGKVFVIRTEGVEGIIGDPLEFGFTSGYGPTSPDALSTLDTRGIVNYIRDIPSGSLYGGGSASAKANTEYISMGHFQAFDTDFMTYLAGTTGIASNIEIFGGDAFLGFFDFARCIKQHAGIYDDISYCTIFPVESNTNFNLREGRHVSRDRSYDVVINPNGVSFGTGVYDKPEALVYNPAYSNDNVKEVTFPALPVNFIDNNELLHTVYYSLKKQDGERLDNFRIFKTANYQNVSGIFGDIIALINKIDKLYYVQTGAVGYLPVNEKQAITGALGAELVIGTGGVIPRFDTTDDFYGSGSQSSVYKTEDGFGFFDFKRKSFCYVLTGKAEALSVIKGLRSFLIDNLTQSSFEMNDSPFSEFGISTVFDNQRKLVLVSFKISTKNNGDPGQSITIAYDILNRTFAGRYGVVSPIYTEFNDKIYSIAYDFAADSIAELTLYALYSFVREGNALYICILSYTSGAPAVAASLDTTHWELVRKCNQIMIHESNDIGKFNGIVQPSYLSLIFNDQAGESKQIDNFEFQQNENFWDNVTLENTWQIAQDLAIDIVSNREYDFRNRIWYATAPQDVNTGKMTDLWTKITLYKTNILNGNPTISKNELIKFMALVTYFEITE